MNRNITICSDSKSVLSQLESLILKPKNVHDIIAHMIKQIARLIRTRNHIKFIFIPGHQEIGANEEVDQLAKMAATVGKQRHHDPFLSTVLLRLRHNQRLKLDKYLRKSIKNSSLHKKAPPRQRFKPARPGKQKHSPYEKQWNTIDPLLNRARTGHTMSRAHLYRIGIEKEKVCRHCNKATETVQHQLFLCKKFKKKLASARRQFRTEIPFDSRSYQTALWTHPHVMKEILNKGKKVGCHI